MPSPTPNAIDPAIAHAVATIRSAKLARLAASNPPSRKEPSRIMSAMRFDNISAAIDGDGAEYHPRFAAKWSRYTERGDD